MVESLLLTPAVTLLDLTVVYWASLILGGGLLLISSLTGSDTDADVGGAHADLDLDADVAFEADVSADADADLGGDFGADTAAAGEHAFSLASWFSLRFMVFATAFFGALGVILTHMTDMNRGLVLGIALGGGFAVGQGVHHLFRLLRRTSGNSAPQPQDYVHKLARVTIAIAPPKKGQVALQVREARRYVPAVSHQPGPALGIGSEVVVVSYRGGIAEVVPREQYESPGHTGQA